MAQNSAQMKSVSSIGPETPDATDPDLVRHGRRWGDVRQTIEERLRGSARQVVEMELKQEHRIFMRDRLPSSELRLKEADEAIRRAPAWRRKRLTEAFDRT